jgi:hypothetical protein
MEEKTVAASVAYCGLMRALCFRAAECDGCKSARSRCERDLSDEGCPNKECCLARGLSGCWECPELDLCAKGMYGPGMSPKVKAFATFIRDEGAAALASRALANTARGWSVEKGGPYDGQPLPEVLRMLRAGPSKKPREGPSDKPREGSGERP